MPCARNGIRLFIVICLGAASGAVHPQSLREALDAAWSRHPEARLLDARSPELDARIDTAQQPFPGAGALTLDARTDRFHRGAGDREYEIEYGVPVWLPGQHSAQTDLARREAAELDAQRASLRLKLAGQLRTSWAARETARSEEELARSRLASARELETDVRRRLRAGEASRFDANRAQSERLGVEAELAAASARSVEAELALQAITGLTRHGPMPEEDTSGPAPAEHQAVSAGRAGAATAQGRARAAAAATRAHPELALFLRRERSVAVEPYSHSIGVRVRIPLSNAPQVRAQTAAAEAEVERAEAALRQIGLQVELEQEKARRDLDAAQRQMELARVRRALAADNLALGLKAYRLGESDLSTLLRTRTADFEAERAEQRARIAHLAARARLNQALGVLP